MAPRPDWPPALVGDPLIARVAQRLGITKREVDERLTVHDLLDEADMALYLFDLDVEPQAAPTPRPGDGNAKGGRYGFEG